MGTERTANFRNRPRGSARLSAGGALLRATTVLLGLLAGGAWAMDVGTIAEVAGTVELGRGGTWTRTAIGAAISQGDSLRTGQPGQVRVVFQDDSVLTMADASELRIDEQTIDHTRGIARSRFRLAHGKARALASESSHQRGAAFTVVTPTAVVRVRGTEFVIVFDPVADVSDVVGVKGRVEVHSALDLVGHTVFVTAGEISTVARGGYPKPARRLRDEEFRQYLDKLEFTGAGRSESLIAGLPLVTGAGVPEGERAAALPEPISPHPKIQPSTSLVPEQRDVSSLVQQPVPVLEQRGKAGIRF